MSAEVLAALLDANAFVPSPLFDDLLGCHVPFDDLVPGTRVESALGEKARRGRAVALVGPSGCGKSAVSTFVLGDVTSDFAPIRAPVFYETKETILEPSRFARYLLQRLLAAAESVAAITSAEKAQLLIDASERVTTPTKTIGHKAGVGVELPWLLKADAAREVSAIIGGADLERSTDDVLGTVDRVIEVLYANGLVPMIVLDDTDRWLRIGETDRRELVAAFFGTIVRMLAERGCGLVVAVHESYFGIEEYRVGTRGFLTESIRLPALNSTEQLASILRHRVALQIESASLADVFDEGVVANCFNYYETAWAKSLRWTLQAVHDALTLACADGTERIVLSHLDDAAAA